MVKKNHTDLNHRGQLCVAIRARPVNEEEQIVFHKPGESAKDFDFKHVFDDSASTSDVYTDVVKSMVVGVANGIDGAVFAYGQTSSGKTHTMLGSNGENGILDMAVRDIFQLISESRDRQFLLKLSFFEINNEKIRDLLSDNPDVENKLDLVKGAYCDATELMVSDYDTIERIMRKGVSHRGVWPSEISNGISNSHTVFKLSVESKDTSGRALQASLNLVDMAGSECIKMKGVRGLSAKDFYFQKSDLQQNQSQGTVSKTAIICCISPSQRSEKETYGILRFISKMRSTEAELDNVKLRRLEDEIRTLKDRSSRADISVGEKTRLEAKFKQLEREKFDIQLQCDHAAVDDGHSVPHEMVGEKTSQIGYDEINLAAAQVDEMFSKRDLSRKFMVSRTVCELYRNSVSIFLCELPLVCRFLDLADGTMSPLRVSPPKGGEVKRKSPRKSAASAKISTKLRNLVPLCDPSARFAKPFSIDEFMITPHQLFPPDASEREEGRGYSDELQGQQLQRQLQGQLSKALEDLEMKKAIIASLREEREMHGYANSALMSQLEAASLQIEHLQDETTRSASKLRETSDALLADALSSSAALEAHIAALSQQLGLGEKKIGRLEGELSQREEELLEMTNQLERSATKVRELESQLESFSSSAADLASRLMLSEVRIGSLEAAKADLVLEKEEAHQAQAALESRLAELKHAVSSHEATVVEVQLQLKSATEKSDAEIESLQAKLERASSTVAELSDRLLATQSSVAGLVQDNARLVAEMKAACEAKSSLEIQIRELSHALSSAENTVADLQMKIAEKEEKKSCTGDQSAPTVDQLLRQLESASSSVADLASQLLASQERVKSLEADKGRLQSEIDATADARGNLEAHMSDLIIFRMSSSS